MLRDQASPFGENMHQFVNRVSHLSYGLVDDIHSLVDDNRPHIPGRLGPRARKLLVSGLIITGTAISTLCKIGGPINHPPGPGLQVLS